MRLGQGQKRKRRNYDGGAEDGKCDLAGVLTIVYRRPG